MITTPIPDEIWTDFDEICLPKGKPEGAITVKDIVERHPVSISSAKLYMNKAVEGGWTNGYFLNNGSKTRCVYRETP